MSLQTSKYQGPPATSRSWEGSTTIVPWSPEREPGPAGTWVLDFWPPGLWENKFLWFTVWSFWFCFDRVACEILVLGSGREPTPPELEAQSLKPGTTGEVPKFRLFATRRPAQPPCLFPSHPAAVASNPALCAPPPRPHSSGRGRGPCTELCISSLLCFWSNYFASLRLHFLMYSMNDNACW